VQNFVDATVALAGGTAGGSAAAFSRSTRLLTAFRYAFAAFLSVSPSAVVVVSARDEPDGELVAIAADSPGNGGRRRIAFGSGGGAALNFSVAFVVLTASRNQSAALSSRLTQAPANAAFEAALTDDWSALPPPPASQLPGVSAGDVRLEAQALVSVRLSARSAFVPLPPLATAPAGAGAGAGQGGAFLGAEGAAAIAAAATGALVLAIMLAALVARRSRRRRAASASAAASPTTMRVGERADAGLWSPASAVAALWSPFARRQSVAAAAAGGGDALAGARAFASASGSASVAAATEAAASSEI